MPAPAAPAAEPAEKDNKGRVVLKALTDDEKATRAKALEGAKIASVEARQKAQEEASRRADEEARLAVEREAAEKREAAVSSERGKGSFPQRHDRGRSRDPRCARLPEVARV